MRIVVGVGVVLMAVVAAMDARPAAARGAAATNLSNSPDDSRNPTLAIAMNGVRRHLVWEEHEQSGFTYLWHRTFDGVGWSPVVTVATGTRPALAVGPDNTAHLVWTDDFSGTLQVFYSQWSGAGWSIPKLAAPGLNGDAVTPSIAVGADNVVRVVWGEFQGGGFKVYYAHADSGGSGPWLYAPVPNATGTAASMALDAGGNVHLVWQQNVGGTYDVLYSTLNGANWSMPENISQTPTGNSVSPAATVMGDGRPLVAWSESVGTQYDVLSSVRGVGWSVPVNVSNSAVDSLRPRLAGAHGTAFVAWNEASTPASVLFAFGGGGWTKALPLANGGGDWSDAALAGAPDGSLQFAYDGGASANGDIFYDSLSLYRTWLPASAR